MKLVGNYERLTSAYQVGMFSHCHGYSSQRSQVFCSVTRALHSPQLCCCMRQPSCHCHGNAAVTPTQPRSGLATCQQCPWPAELGMSAVCPAELEKLQFPYPPHHPPFLPHYTTPLSPSPSLSLSPPPSHHLSTDLLATSLPAQ